MTSNSGFVRPEKFHPYMHLMLCVYDYITETVTIWKLKLLGARLCISLGVLLLVLDHLWLLIYSIGVHASLKYVTSNSNHK